MAEHIRTFEKKKKWLIGLLVFGSIAAALKCIFVSLQMDEEYAISMPYRLLKNDRLFTQLWDPHQTSAFVIEFLMWIYISIFHTTTYLVIFVRIMGVLMQGLVSWCLFRTARHIINREESFLVALIYFNLLPKGYVMPEFSNMMVWSLTLLLICMTRLAAYQGKIPGWTYSLPEQKKNRLMLLGYAEAGFWLCMMALSYPSCVFLYPFLVIYLWKYDVHRVKAIGIVTAVCAVIGGAYLANLFSYMTVASLLENVKSLMASSGSHHKTAAWLFNLYSKDLARLLGLLAVMFGLTFLITRLREHFTKKKEQELLNRKLTFMFTLLITAFVLQFIHWILMLWEYESSYPFTVYFILFGFLFYLSRKMKTQGRQMIFLWLGANVVMFVAIMLLTNLTIFTSVKYLMPGVMAAIVLLIIFTKEKAPEVYQKYAVATLLIWCFVAAFVKGWAYPDNDGLMKNITVVGNVLSEGAGKGILTEYMQGYMQESDYEEFQKYIKPGDNLLVMDSNTLCYLYQDVNYSASTTICTPTFDANLLDYWERNPDKYPDVIAVQCWYGQLKYSADSWMIKWIENEYHADQVVDGKYFRYYIRER